MQYVEHATGPLRVLHAGEPSTENTPMVLIHGGGSDNSAISWYRLMEPLSADREVWAIDLPGFGGSLDATPVGGPDAMADVVAEVLTALEVDSVIAAGVSMGGDVVLNFALRHAERLAAVIAIAAGGLIPVWNNPIANLSAWATAQVPDFLMVPAAHLGNQLTGTVVRGMVHDIDTIPTEVIREFEREAQEPRSVVGHLRYSQATLGVTGMRNDLTDRLPQISAPTLLFHGDSDPLVDIKGSQRAAERIPDARLVTIANCGHWAQLEAHDLFLAETREFLSRVDTTTSA